MLTKIVKEHTKAVVLEEHPELGFRREEINRPKSLPPTTHRYRLLNDDGSPTEWVDNIYAKALIGTYECFPTEFKEVLTTLTPTQLRKLVLSAIQYPHIMAQFAKESQNNLERLLDDEKKDTYDKLQESVNSLESVYDSMAKIRSAINQGNVIRALRLTGDMCGVYTTLKNYCLVPRS